MPDANCTSSVAILAQATSPKKLKLHMQPDSYTCCPVVVPAQSSGGDRNSGHNKRKRKRALPRAFFVFDKFAGLLHGVMMVDRCASLVHRVAVYWRVVRFIAFQACVQLEAASVQWSSTILHLTPDAESSLRQVECSLGGPIADHFCEVADSQWHVWPLDREQLGEVTDAPLTLKSEVAFLRAVGVDPVIVEVAPDAREECRQDLASCCASAENLAHGDGAGIVGPPPLDEPGALPCAARKNLGDMKLGGRGAVDHRWTPRGIILCLQLALTLRPGVPLAECLAAAVMLLVTQPDAVQLRKDLLSGAIPLPSVGMLRQARVRLDLMNIMFQRSLLRAFWFIRFISVDSSPQLGRNFLCMREDRIRFNRADMYNVEALLNYDYNANFETRVCPLSTLGTGHASAVKKCVNVASVYLMETETCEEFDEVRSSLYGMTTDQGTEKVISEMSLDSIPGRARAHGPGDARSFLWQNCLHICGHLHILFNGLREACESLSIAEWFFNSLRTMAAFLSDVQMRRKLQATCLVGEACSSSFDHFARVHVDWRWEFLSPAIDSVTAVFGHMQRFFKVGPMLASEKGSSSSKLIEEVWEVLQSGFKFLGIGAMFKLAADVVGRYASRLEGCHCHGDIWTMKRSFARRKAELKAATNSSHCFWKGRQGPWWVAVGLSEMFCKIRAVSSSSFEALMCQMNAVDRAEILAYFTELKAKLCEIYTEKFSFWHHIPYRMLGVFYGALGGCMEKARDLARACVEEFDAAVAAGKQLHRVAMRLLDPAKAVGRQFREFIISLFPLQHFRRRFSV